MRSSPLAVAALGALSIASVAAPPTAPILPIKYGYYAEAPGGCAAAVRDWSGIAVEKNSMYYNDFGFKITKATKRPTGEYLVSERWEDESGGFMVEQSLIKVIDANSFSRVLLQNGRANPADRATYRFCSAKIPEI